MSSIREKPFWVRIALLGFGLYLALILTYIVVSTIAGDGEGVVFSAIAGVPGLIAAVLVWKVGSWGYLVAALLSAFGLLFFVANALTGIAAPDSFFDFITATVGYVGLILAFGGCVTSFFQARSGKPRMSGAPMAVMAVRALLVLILVTAFGSAVLTVVNRETVSAADKKDAIIVTASKSEWSTDKIESSSAGTLRLVIKNSDPYLHTFTARDLNMDFRVKPGSEQLIVLDHPLAGSHEFLCTIHTEMKGIIEVR